MGSIKYESRKNLTIYTVVGNLDFRDFMKVYEKFYNENPTKNVLFNLKRGNLNNITSEQIYIAVQFLKNNLDKRPLHAKTAFVLIGSGNYGMIRMHQILSEIKEIDLRTEIFSTIQEAMAWLYKD